MPNIYFITDDPSWPQSLDDLRQEPGRLVFSSDLARLKIATSYNSLKRLPDPLNLPGLRKAWEARTILEAIGAPLPPTEGEISEAGAATAEKAA